MCYYGWQRAGMKAFNIGLWLLVGGNNALQDVLMAGKKMWKIRDILGVLLG